MLEQKARVGEFEIIRLLGQGGMGEVYEARQSHPDRRVALKVLTPWLAGNKEALERFWREAEVPAQLDHPAVVRIYSTGTCNGIAYYVMQLVNGISLARLIERSNEPTPATRSYGVERAPLTTPVNEVTVDVPAPPIDEADLPITQEFRTDRFRTLAKIGIQAARALAWTHKKGFLHRDIKPSNIMIDHHDQVYLLDFGLTRALESSGTSRIGTVIGTPYFMSPEQAVGQSLDARSDIFSLGVTLYQLASKGQGPYRAARKDSDAVLREVRSGGMMSLRALAADIPLSLESIIKRAIDPDPARRYQKADELADDLERFLKEPALLPAPALPTSSTRIGSIWIGGAVVALLAVVSLGIYVVLFPPWRDRPEPDGKIAQNPPDDKKEPPKEKEKEPEKPPTLRDFFKRDRPLKTPMALLRTDNQPILGKQVLEKPIYHPMSKELILISNHKQKPGLLALDDPGDQDFEFSIEMKHWDRNTDGRHDVGIFFGYHEDVGLERPRFFTIAIDPKADNQYPHGRLNIGTWRFDEATKLRIGMSEQNPIVLWHSKDGMKGFVPLPPPRDQRFPYYRIVVRVEGKSFTIGVDNDLPVEFSLAWILAGDKRLAAGYSLNPHGALGVWTRAGQACFKNATVTALTKDR